MQVPCKQCESKGCGIYHNNCPEYQEYLKYKEDCRNNMKKLNDSGRSPYIKDSTYTYRSRIIVRKFREKV